MPKQTTLLGFILFLSIVFPNLGLTKGNVYVSPRVHRDTKQTAYSYKTEKKFEKSPQVFQDFLRNFAPIKLSFLLYKYELQLNHQNWDHFQIIGTEFVDYIWNLERAKSSFRKQDYQFYYIGAPIIGDKFIAVVYAERNLSAPGIDESYYLNIYSTKGKLLSHILFSKYERTDQEIAIEGAIYRDFRIKRVTKKYGDKPFLVKSAKQEFYKINKKGEIRAIEK